MTDDRRGSRKHVLDLVSSGKAAVTLTRLMADTGVAIGPADRVRPVSHAEAEEWGLRAFCRLCAHLPSCGRVPSGSRLRRAIRVFSPVHQTT
jgi:hypothetical protein